MANELNRWQQKYLSDKGCDCCKYAVTVVKLKAKYWSYININIKENEEFHVQEYEGANPPVNFGPQDGSGNAQTVQVDAYNTLEKIHEASQILLNCMDDNLE